MKDSKKQEFLIENFIPEGNENAISRIELRLLTDKNDRTVREMIAEAVNVRKIPIVNVGNGYFIVRSGNEEDRMCAREYIAMEMHRHREIVRRIHAIDKALGGFRA